jgi:O-antigen ligase
MIQIRGTDVAYANTLFRFFVWRDMILEFSQHKPILGFSFGKPFRSESLEIMDWAINEWIRDGWIEPHNSYLNIVYRMGIIGVALIVFLIWQFCSIVKSFVSLKSLTGILLCSTLIIFLVAGNFLPIFELPFSAIPFWALWGMTLGYLKEIKPEGRYP